MKKMIIFFYIIFSISCSNITKEPIEKKEKVVVQKEKPKTEEELRQELFEKELKYQKKIS